MGVVRESSSMISGLFYDRFRRLGLLSAVISATESIFAATAH